MTREVLVRELKWQASLFALRDDGSVPDANGATDATVAYYRDLSALLREAATVIGMSGDRR